MLSYLSPRSHHTESTGLEIAPDRDGSRDQDKHSTQDAPFRMDEENGFLGWVGCLGSTDVVDRCLEWLRFDGWLQYDSSCFSCFEVGKLADR